MELKFKKTALAALLGLSVAGVANAAGFTPACTPQAVTVPCERTAWDVAIEGLWVEPTKDDLNYFQTFHSTTNDFRTTNHYIEPDYDWGFRLEGSYHFGTGNDLTINWTSFDQDNSSSVRVPEGDGSSMPFFSDIDGASSAFNVNGRVDFDFDEVNLELGQHLDVGDKVDFRVHMGVQYVKVDNELSTTFSYENNDYRFNWTSDFDGIGPRFGLDFFYHFGNGFSLVGRASGAVLVGELDSSFNYRYTTDNGNTHNTFVINNGSDRRTVVPTAETRIGVNYAHQMSQGTVSLELGYQVNGYFNTVLHTDAFIGGLRNNVTNFGLHGAYLTLKYVS